MALARFLVTLLLSYVAILIVGLFATVGAFILLICFWGAADVVIVRFLESYFILRRIFWSLSRAHTRAGDSGDAQVRATQWHATRDAATGNSAPSACL